MNQIKSLFINLLTVCTLIFFTACPFNPDNEFYLRGKEISNYPEWLDPFQYTQCIGISEWLDWQSDQGKKLHSYVPESVISSSYEGKFRLRLSGQGTILDFNDSNETGIIILYNWVAKVKSCANGIDIPQKDIENKFEYDCYVKKSLYDGETDENKAVVVLTRLSDKTATINEFNYNLKIKNKEIININLKNNMPTKKVYIDYSKHSWIPNVRNYIRRDNDKGTLELDLYYYGCGTRKTACYEGISLRGEIDDVNKTISFNLLDAKQSGFADYFTLKVTNDLKTASIIYYKLENDELKVVRCDEKLECTNYIANHY